MMKISQRFNLYAGLALTAGFVALLFINARGHDRLLMEVGRSEAERLSRAVYSELLTSMKLGGGRIQDREIIERYRAIDGVRDVRVVHGEIIDRDYGVEKDEGPLDAIEAKALGGRHATEVINDGGRRFVRYAMPMVIKKECVGCHRAPLGTVAGAISMELSLDRYISIIGRHSVHGLIWWVVILLGASMVGLAVVRKRLIKPIETIKKGLEALARGDFDYRVELSTSDELEELGRAFNETARSLKSAAESLNAVSKKYATLMDMAADAILVTDVESMRYVDVNRAATILTGYSKEELLGMEVGRLLPVESREEYLKMFRRWVYDGRGFLNDAFYERKDSTRVPVEVSATLLELNGERLVQEIVRDVTERKGFEEKLKKQIEELEEKVKERTADLDRSLRELDEAYNKLKTSQQKLVQSAKLVSLGEMGAGIAHELNSPLAGILSLTEVLMSRTEPSDRNYFLLEKIKDAAIRSKYIILDMLNYARPFRGDYTRVHINTAIRSTLSLFVSEIRSSSIEIKLDLDPEVPAVRGNRGQLMEVLFNIIKNAADAVGVKGVIGISTRSVVEADRENVVIEVRDTGPGIPPEVMDRIFDPFFTTKGKGGGKNVGLGLSISRSIIDEHGGRIEAENMAEGGACFRIILPAAGAEENPVDETMED